jgi:tetratricopeptide (TPR) repeat protein
MRSTATSKGFRVSTHQRRNQRLQALALGVGGILAVTAIVLGAGRIVALFGDDPSDSYYELWDTRDYAGIVTLSEAALEDDALHSTTLIFRGLALFYQAVTQFSLEDKLPLLDESISNLRKALLFPDNALTPRIHYVLGKAYYLKGKFYADLTIEYLQKSLEAGFRGEDAYQYLGFAHSELGDYEKSIEYFEMAVEETPTDGLLNALGMSYYRMGMYGKAEEYLLRTLNRTEDNLMLLNTWELLGLIYRDTNKLLKAEEIYGKILEKNPRSADAHYYLGEIYEVMGDEIRARFEWKEALRIDPTHYGARRKYYGE